MKRFLMKGLAILIACLLVVCGFQSPIPRFGPGLTDAATAAIDLGPLTPTDVTLVGDTVEPMATTVPQVKNVLVTVTMNRSDVYSGVTRTYYDTAKMSLHKFDCKNVPVDESEYLHYKNGSSSYFEVGVQPGAYYGNGAKIGYIYFVAPSTQNNLLSSVICSTVSATGSNGTQLTDAFTFHQALMGDVNQDNVIDATDSLKAMQFGVGTTTLTADQQLAADVNLDGTVDSNDGLLINQYAVQTLASFWDKGRFNIPAANVEGVGDNNVFRLKNVSDSKYLTTATTTSLPVYLSTTYNPKQNIAKFKFERASGAGYYRIRHVASGALLRLDNNYKTTLSTTNVITGSYHWYVVPVAGGFQIVNQTDTGLALTNYGYPQSGTTNCGADYIDRGNVWTLETSEININYFYDYGYAARRGSNAVNSINQYKDDIANILSTVFGVTVNISTTTTKTRSYSDLCFGNTTITSTNIKNHWCTHCSSQANNGNTACAAYTGPLTSSTLVHHKCAGAVLDYLRNEKQPTNYSAIEDIQLLISGHSPCGNEVGGTNHEFDNVGGLANIYERVAVVFNDAAGPNDFYDKITLLHEISHCLGAGHLSNSKADTGETEDHINCVMSYEADKTNVLNAWNQTGGKTYSDLYCVDCKAEIQRYLGFNY